MRYLKRSLLLAILCICLFPFAGGSSAWAGPVQRQEAEEERHVKRIKRVSVGESPCVSIVTRHHRGSLGIQLIDITPDLRVHFGAPADAGVIVAEVAEKSPAFKAGVRVGDILTGIDGQEVSSARGVARAVRRKSDGDEVALELRRDGKLTELTATIEVQLRSEIDVGGIFAGVDCDEMDFTMDLHIDEEAIQEAVEKATEHFESSEWLSQLRLLENLDEDFLGEKMEELEKRLKELEEELEKKQSRLVKQKGGL